ncbi:thioredoxin domain-containing protein [Thiomicrospira sp. S5]|uniref:thioredoxin domain-containing protein n=1 Tax=Thiomicrospira sp. S5 TaxID=1803865 RepID=UPI000F8A11D9|nr:DUF255 domain-containing protein [Thiomicrospira sp. S5]AZR81218.1 hypothetical protein AYJ59_02260 [Thiomicrospira sp. S5]
MSRLLPVLFSLVALPAFAATVNNTLVNHPSPYLAMHSEDPVHWQEWQASVLKDAQRDNKLIFLSSGYFACHWCHVMQQENYQDKDVARLLNQHFIPVKIDRELSPDLDRYLIEFAEKAAGHAGWPQHVILTPNGLPFFAFVYQPKSQLMTTLHRVQRLWETQPQRIIQAAQSGLNETPSHPRQNAPEHLTLTSSEFQRRFNQALGHQMDDLSGGLKGSHKFPNASVLWTALQPNNTDDSQAEHRHDWLQLTLDQMQSQHLFDHVHGGFYRYTVDPEWQTPHFEKMLYSQAQLAQVYFRAAQVIQRDDYLDTARQTLRYAERHLWNPATHLFRGSQSAIDDQQVEGGPYLWTKTELQARLTPAEYAKIDQAWSLQGAPPYEAGWHPKPTNQHWASIRRKLQRAPSDIPTDDKSLLGWNGLMLSAYAEAVRQDVANRPHWQTQAKQLAKRLTELMQLPQPPRALSLDNQPIGQANLQDYAYVLQGLKDWQTQASAPALKQAIHRLQQQATQRFFSPEGWHFSDAPLLPGQVGHWALPDDALPSPTAILDCGNAAHLAHSQTEIARYPLRYASYGHALNCPESKSN